MTYGTGRRNAYQILEDSLNLKDSRVYVIIVEDGKEKRVLNKKETTIAAQKQDAMREAFRDWVFRDRERREVLVGKYNVLFNSTRPREYDGSHLVFPGMTPDIELKDYQKNAVAHVLYGNNTLLAHCVGAGKTFEMTAAAMESKRLGIMPEESVCRTQSSDRAVGRRFFAIVSGSQYFSGNQERLPACQPQKVLLTDRYRRL